MPLLLIFISVWYFFLTRVSSIFSQDFQVVETTKSNKIKNIFFVSIVQKVFFIILFYFCTSDEGYYNKSKKRQSMLGKKKTKTKTIVSFVLVFAWKRKLTQISILHFYTFQQHSKNNVNRNGRAYKNYFFSIQFHFIFPLNRSKSKKRKKIKNRFKLNVCFIL